MKKNKTPLNLPLTRETLKKHAGFTLFELLVSISIIGILTALASVAFSGAQKKARDARRMEDIKLIQVAAEQYYSQNTFRYPANYAAGSVWGIGGTNILENYPSDPKGATYGVYGCATGFTCGTAGYCICANTENDNGNANSDVNCNFAAATKTHFCAKNQQ